jgi:DNA polymerase-3 subunit alpha
MNSIVKIKDCIIKVPDYIVISEDNSKIHGITNDISLSKGIDIIEVLEEFFEDFNISECVVGHNVSFDLNIIKAELNRLIYANSNNKIMNFQKYLNILGTSQKIYCTMKVSIDLCAIETKDKFGRTYNKFPKLIELYEKLFNVTPNNLHNSLNDVIVCLRCFMKLKYDRDIIEHSEEVKKLIKDCL